MKKSFIIMIVLSLLITGFMVGCRSNEVSDDSILKNNSDKEVKENYGKAEASNIDMSSSIKEPQSVDMKIDTSLMSQDFFTRNRKIMMEEIEDNSVVILISDYANERHPYYPNSNLYYLSGMDEEQNVLMLVKSKGNVKEYIFQRESNPMNERWTGKVMSQSESQQLSGINNINSIDRFEGEIRKIISKGDIERIYLDLGNISDFSQLSNRGHMYKFPSTSAEVFALEIIGDTSDIEILNINETISEMRAVKTLDEIDKIKIAIAMTGEGIKSLMKNTKPNMTEYQLEAYFDFVTKSLGATEDSFLSIAASGENANILHYVDNDSELKDGELILFDVGVDYNNYSSDISRTFPVNGKFTDRQKEIYNVVLNAQEKVIQSVRPGISLRDLHEISKKELAKGCIEIGLIKNENEINNYYFHYISHHLGLDVHDPSGGKQILEPGMVITVEPGLYIDEEGIGIRIEDDILVSEDGYVNLSEDIIKSIEDIEEFMKE